MGLLLSGLACVTRLDADETGEYLLEPLFTRYAQTYDKITVDLRERYFDDLRLQEINHFDGWTTDLTVTFPFNERFEITVLLPIYTYGRANRFDVPTHDRVTVKGPGAIFDYPSIYFAHQLIEASTGPVNAGYFLGVGAHLDEWGQLQTTHKDILNHQGLLLHGGLRADRFFADGKWRLAANVGGRYYYESDDLNPGGGSDHFYHLEASGAAVYHPKHLFLHPAAELEYRGDLNGYNAVWVVPEVLIPISSSFEMRIGVPLRMTQDGERFGVNLHLTARF